MMAERENIPLMLCQLREQTLSCFSVYVCVNQLEGDESDIYADNQASLALLGEAKDLDIHIIDRSSRGLGWQGKRRGVGWARKELFSAIIQEHDDNEVVISMDADTAFSATYMESVLRAMNEHPQWSALSVPYYHPLSGNEGQDRAMLRYECYMRHYLLNLLIAGNPYAFSALGSAMVFPAWAYKRVGGITPLQGGEDFYLMQKFAKTGTYGRRLGETVFPQGRISHRVPFGTGPAISRGINVMESEGTSISDGAYPFFPQEGFAAVKESFDTFPLLYDHDIEMPMTKFLKEQFGTDDLWTPLRKNFRTRELFVHACQEKVDGLRILQYLKTWLSAGPSRPDEHHLVDFCQKNEIEVSDGFSFLHTPLDEVNALRNRLFEFETSLR